MPTDVEAPLRVDGEPMSAVRVVSLVPSVTETLSAWGVQPVACTRFCERPDLVHVGGTKNPDVAAIVVLEPDLVVVDRQENRREDAEALGLAGVVVLALDVTSMAGLSDEMDRLADAVGVVAPPIVVPHLRPLGVRAFVPIWRRPWMSIGGDTYGSSLLAELGVINVYDTVAGYPVVELAEVAALAPDVVLVPSEPYEFSDAHVEELADVAPVRRIDGRDLFWWGARTEAAARRLRAAIG